MTKWYYDTQCSDQMILWYQDGWSAAYWCVSWYISPPQSDMMQSSNRQVRNVIQNHHFHNYIFNSLLCFVSVYVLCNIVQCMDSYCCVFIFNFFILFGSMHLSQTFPFYPSCLVWGRLGATLSSLLVNRSSPCVNNQILITVLLPRVLLAYRQR